MPNEIVSTIRGNDPSQPVTEMPKLGEAEGRGQVWHGGLGAVHEAEVTLGDELFSFVLAITELERQVMRHVGDAGIDGTRWANGVDIVEGNLSHHLFLEFVWQGIVVRLLDIFHR